MTVGALATNCYILVGENKQAIIVDPGDDADYIINTLNDLRCQPVCLMATHGHFDHILAARELQLAFKIPFMIHTADRFLISRMQETARHFLEYEVVESPPEISSTLNIKVPITLDRLRIEVIESPGHTPGSVCLYIPEAQTLLSGDTLFANGGVGRTDFSYSSQSQLVESLEKILRLPGETLIYPGHGPATTIAKESKIHRVAV
ncbi:MAG: Beta-lactamase domain protein [Candidatus Gottesmanbacteria bacterium GW2011_GWA1_43_11]|uniref:Beta-lactamase domain protein n=1 Tax=Candidatus Gottesmanbacteria bacterium GW2011_GWA1_43_11 TaxID=1618436 RepID=A0A0G1EPU4_9BACT|nr:MAG: Beta-lactamase domain protein [Candidatus Gottesmanbacteria bacterium GW2011_GWA1_43_11]